MRIAMLLLASLVTCNSESTPPPQDQERQLARTPANVTTAAVSAKASEPTHPQQGSWRAAFTATKASVDLPEAAPRYDAWQGDDGSLASGKGEISLSVTPDGGVTGSVSGSLGDMRIQGAVEEGTLRAVVTPTEPQAPQSLSGVLVAVTKGADFIGTLRASGHHGNVVRKADVKLEKHQ